MSWWGWTVMVKTCESWISPSPNLDKVLCLSGQEMAPTRQMPLLKDTLGARNEDLVGGATCWASNCLYNICKYIVSWSWAVVQVMCRVGVVTGHTSSLASNDVDVWLTWRCPWSSVPLTVGFILRLDRVLRFVVIVAFCVHHLAASRSVGFEWFTGLIWKSPLWQYWW